MYSDLDAYSKNEFYSRTGQSGGSHNRCRGQEKSGEFRHLSGSNLSDTLNRAVACSVNKSYSGRSSDSKNEFHTGPGPLGVNTGTYPEHKTDYGTGTLRQADLDASASAVLGSYPENEALLSDFSKINSNVNARSKGVVGRYCKIDPDCDPCPTAKTSMRFENKIKRSLACDNNERSKFISEFDPRENFSYDTETNPDKLFEDENTPIKSKWHWPCPEGEITPLYGPAPTEVTYTVRMDPRFAVRAQEIQGSRNSFSGLFNRKMKFE